MSMPRSLAAAALVAALCAATAWAAPSETAGTTAMSGSVTVRSAGATSAAGPDTRLKPGDAIAVAAGARATVRFEDGSTVDLVGPAEMSFIQLENGGRRVRLDSGAIARADVRGVALEVQTPGGPSLVLQNAQATASVSGSTSTFAKTGGDYAKVWSNGAFTDLGASWSNAPKPAPAVAPAPAKPPVATAAQPAVQPSGDETGSVGALVGSATVESGGEVSRVNAGTRFKPGDVVRVASGGRLVLRFADGAFLSMVGPAEMQLVQLSGSGRRVMLRSGVVSEAFVRGVAVEVQTPYDASLVLQNATGFARVAPGDRVSFQKLDGDLAAVYHAGKMQDLSGGWTLNVRSGGVSGVSDGGATAAVRGDTGVLQIGGRNVAYTPKNDFQVEMRGDGGAKLTYEGGDFGTVQLGADSVFFLANGDFIEIDGNGSVVNFTGISHIYHPLGDAIFYDEPVENAADASVSTPGRR